MSGPFTSPVAYSIPFNASDPLAVSAGISSQDVFNAIIEVKADALNNDRYPVQASYGGNANTGRYLEVYPSLASDDANAPLIIPEASKISAYTAGAVSNSTGVVTIRNLTTATDLIDIAFSANKEVNATGLSITGISPNDHLGFYIKSGSINKPYIRVWFNTIT
jgi:hypothetical protein